MLTILNQLLILPTASLPTGVPWQCQGVLQWLHLLHSPAKVITPYHNMVAKLVAMGHFHTVQLLELEPSHLPRNNKFGYGTLMPCDKMH
jgi:hypothetical protein